jgi:hypothetical protein
VAGLVWVVVSSASSGGAGTPRRLPGFDAMALALYARGTLYATTWGALGPVRLALEGSPSYTCRRAGA